MIRRLLLPALLRLKRPRLLFELVEKAHVVTPCDAMNSPLRGQAAFKAGPQCSARPRRPAAARPAPGAPHLQCMTHGKTMC